MKKLKFIIQEIKTLFGFFWAGITSPFTMVVIVTIGGVVAAAYLPRDIKDEYITPLFTILWWVCITGIITGIICFIGGIEKLGEAYEKDEKAD